jgi:hypothetical protein
MQTFRLDDKPHQVAGKWAELTAEQLLAVAPHLVTETAAGRLAVFRLLCPQVPRKLLRKLTADQLWDLLQLVAWVWREAVDPSALTGFAHRGRHYLLPEPHLADAVAIEYAMAKIYFQQFAHPTRPSTKALDQLVATLCRPARADLATVRTEPTWDGQRRERYNAKLAEQRALELADAPLSAKIMVLHHFLAAQRYVHVAYRELFKKPEPAAEGQPAAKAPVSDGTEVLELLHGLAETGTYGTWEAVAYTNLHTIFFNQAKAARRRREAERNA